MRILSNVPLRLPLIGKTPAEQTLKELVEFAKKKENWFTSSEKSAEARRADKTRTDPRPEGGHHAPCSRHIKIDDADGSTSTYHIVFTIDEGQLAPCKPDGSPDMTKLKNVLCRHATIGVDDFSRLPEQVESYTILKFLGFHHLTQIRMLAHPDYQALVFWEEVTEEEEKTLRAQT